MNRTNCINESFSGSATASNIYETDYDRQALIFYAVTGTCQIVIGDNDFDSNAISLEEGTMWQPRKILTGNIWYKGAGTVLSVISEGGIPVVQEYDVAAPSGDWLTDNSGDYITDNQGEYLYE